MQFCCLCSSVSRVVGLCVRVVLGVCCFAGSACLLLFSLSDVCVCPTVILGLSASVSGIGDQVAFCCGRVLASLFAMGRSSASGGSRGFKRSGSWVSSGFDFQVASSRLVLPLATGGAS